MAWVAAGFAIAGFAIAHIVLSRGMMCVAAAILTVFAILAAAIGIDQLYGEYATIGSLFGEDSYSQADLTGLAKRKDLITVAQWRKQAANGTIRNIPANGTVNKIDIPATKSQFEARKASSTCLRRHWPTRNASRPCGRPHAERAAGQVRDASSKPAASKP